VHDETGNTHSWNVTSDAYTLIGLTGTPAFIYNFDVWDASNVGKNQTYSAYFVVQ